MLLGLFLFLDFMSFSLSMFWIFSAARKRFSHAKLFGSESTEVGEVSREDSCELMELPLLVLLGKRERGERAVWDARGGWEREREAEGEEREREGGSTCQEHEAGKRESGERGEWERERGEGST